MIEVFTLVSLFLQSAEGVLTHLARDFGPALVAATRTAYNAATGHPVAAHTIIYEQPCAARRVDPC
jgi:hypothetical protein